MSSTKKKKSTEPVVEVPPTEHATASNDDDIAKRGLTLRPACSTAKKANLSGERDGDDHNTDPDFVGNENQADVTRPSAAGPRTPRQSSQKKSATTPSIPCHKDFSKEHLFKEYQKCSTELAYLRNVRKEDARIKKERNEKIDNYIARGKADREKISNWKSMHDSQKQQTAEANDRAKASAAKTKHIQDMFDNMQSERLNLLKRSDIPAQDDGEVKRLLTSLLRRSKDWIRTWSMSDWSYTTQADIDVISKSLTEVDGFISKRAKVAVSKGHVSPRVVLQTLLNFELFYKIFVKPLTVLATATTSVGGADQASFLKEVLRLLQNRSPPAAHRLRALTLFAYTDKPVDEQDDPSSYGLTRLKTQIEHQSDRMMHKIKLACAPLLKSVPERDVHIRDRHLQQLIRDCFDTSVRINAQNPTTLIVFRPNIPDRIVRKENDYFGWHRALKLREDEGDDDMPTAEQAGLLGQEVDLVVEPAIVRTGDPDGLNYDDVRVLEKAIVWMVRGSDLNQASTIGSNLREKATARDVGKTPEHSFVPSPDTSATINKPPARIARPLTGPKVGQQTAASSKDPEASTLPKQKGGRKRGSDEADCPSKKRRTTPPDGAKEAGTIRTTCVASQSRRSTAKAQEDRTVKDEEKVRKPAEEDDVKQDKTIKAEDVDTVTVSDVPEAREGGAATEE